MNTAIMVVIHQSKALILKRGLTAPWRPGTWNLPGGEISTGETPAFAAVRELYEEAGIVAKEIRYVGCYRPGFNLFVFATEVDGDDVILRANDGIIESDAWAWVDETTVDGYDYCMSIVESIIRRVLALAKGDYLKT